ncbi:hypothetical protein BDQ94DRAFT_154409 [Aspergillus welwitschiae]|uniref:Uncharacterized protein n=1 Tax=Aspergillus welwitschiae TaxID=1341132 RepID=A0A3F3PLG6_9EURO|nr:hypothetical protein BDQ94DRAFT_154409 [Aspergillus welwitschiae]RDH27196.1 hypothetical protein BDQ94DRAFT_154409 [Aspergillus welwitschiae]
MVNCALSLGAEATGFRLSRSQWAAGTVSGLTHIGPGVNGRTSPLTSTNAEATLASDHPANPWIGNDQFLNYYFLTPCIA